MISGPPASGKTTLASPLADALGWPLLSKDVIKETLYDELGSPRTRRRSKEIGRASFEVLFALLEQMPTAVIETYWHPDLSGPRLRSMDRPMLEVFCRCDREMRLDRIGVRERHPGHLESRWNLVPRWAKRRMSLGSEEPLGLGGPLLEVDTTAPIDAVEVAAWVTANLPT
ncbi:MAG: hypothetical protein V7636_1297 [Actinomycetota bacterium]